jgi:hypothetical protein
MIGLVKDDWLINNHNIFELQQDIELSISVIQYEILNQIELKDINSIEKYLRFEVDISQEIWGTENLTIEKVFADFLGLESINPLEQITIKISQVLNYLQLSLLKEYYENKHKNILTFSQYKTQYNLLLQSFLNSNIDTDEQDFIKVELSFCNKLITELDKPVYSLISPLNKIIDKPCDFKKNLTNSIDKRKKFLEQKEKEKLQPVKENETEKKIEIWYSEFIDMALRWGIDAVYNSRTENNPYSVYDHFVKNARINFDLFAQQLNTKLTENENWKAIEIDLNNRFLIGLKKYINWYNENRKELNKFQPYCPYSLMLNVIESTKAEIIKYFPDLENKVLPPLQTEMPKPEQDEVLSFQITHPKRTEIANAIKSKYRSYKGKDFKILYEALLQLDLFPKKGKRSVFFRCLQNEGYNINNVQMLEDKHFKKGQILKTTDKYLLSEDERQRDEIIEHLKTIIETK